MVKMTESKQPLTASMLAEICEASPAYHGKLAAERKLPELQAKLSSIRQKKSDLQRDRSILNESQAQKQVNHDSEKYLDTGKVPESKNLMEVWQKEEDNLRDEETLIMGAIEIQKMRVMEAKNAYVVDVLPRLQAMHKVTYRQYIFDALEMHKKTVTFRELAKAGEQWELPEYSLKCGVPWQPFPGSITDSSSGLHVSLRYLVEDGVMEESERVNLLNGGEFIP